MSKQRKISYKQAGVDYQILDPIKQLAQRAGKKTAVNLENTGLKEIEASRGESAYVIDTGEFYLAVIEECLGTKCLIADEMRRLKNKTYYDSIAQDTIAMMVNDIAAVGARPLTILAYWAAGSDKFFKDRKKMNDLIRGWQKACDLSGASWGGGETPILTGIIKSNAVDLAGACVGIIKPKKRLTLGQNLRAGDSIILLASNGIHANGLSLARKVAACLPDGYATKLTNKIMYGEALLKPTIIYSPLIQELFDKQVNIHYLVNITGHGWRKIMRHRKPFTYRLTNLPPVPVELEFIQRQAGLSDKEAYQIFNMGAGFAVFLPPRECDKVIKIAKKYKIAAYLAGEVTIGEKQVIIEPKNIVYKEESLQLRG